ncbi:MAG: polysaccharide biosynthesis tyrosine autokinase [Planctomycetes bacterium]|nr:polysaccharide biosynthesis tyrosine autokinase [Planctomycetota bacterium]
MAIVNPLLDPTSPQTHHHAAHQGQTAEQPNILLGVLRRWPWLVLGLTVGVVLGLLYHMQQAPIYQSTAKLMVIKNRPDLVSGGAGDARVQYVEDYVGPQVILLQSEIILKIAAEKRLDEQKPFQVPPPDGIPERVAYMKARLSVAREKESGLNIPSNVLVLSFKSLHPADAPKYLNAIIAAYKDDLSGVFEDASTRQLKILDEEIARLKKAQQNNEVLLDQAERKLRGVPDPATGGILVPGISQETPERVQQRISDSRGAQIKLELDRIAIEIKLKQIREAGKTRSERLATMARLGVQTERPSIFGDLRDPESMLAHLKYKRGELGARLGPGHPDMLGLTSQIKVLEDEIAHRGGPADDELERYRRKLESDLAGIVAQLEVLGKAMATDEEVFRRMAPIQLDIKTLTEKGRQIATELQTATREQARVAGSRTSGGYEVRDVSKPADGVQVAPMMMQSLLLGGVLGLLFGGAIALRSELGDRGFRSPDDIRRRLGLPILAHIPLIRIAQPPEVKPTAALDPVLAVFLRPKSAEAEAIRGLRTQLLFSVANRSHQVVQITSPTAGDGKSSIAANLAIALARADKRVVLVDCDFRKPRVHKLFALADATAGLASVVADQADLGDAIQTCEIENLSLLPCGPRPANPAELLTSPKFQEILTDLRASYDFVLLDTPPVLAVSDPAAVAPRADGVIIVFRMTAAAGPNAERAKEELVAVSARILGVVVNASTEQNMGYGYGYTYKYDYQYSDSYTDPQKPQ